MDLKTKFLRIYANLPFGARDEIIAVINGEPFTWKSAKLEIEQDTTLAKEIIDTLVKLGILK